MTMRRATWMVAVWLAVPAPSALASVHQEDPSPRQRFAQGNAYYREGRFQEAVTEYQAILGQGLESPALYLNLGNALLQADELGEAIIAYTRGLRLNPRQPDLRANLEYAQSLTTDAVPETDGSPVLEWLAAVVRSVSDQEAALIAAAGYWLLVLVLVAGRMLPEWRRAANGVVCGLLPVLALALTLAIVRARAEWDDDRAVIVVDAVEVRTGPGEHYTARFTLHEGTLVELRRDASAWQEVELTADYVGWVPASAIDRI